MALPRLLYLAHRIPFPPNKGDKIRAYYEIKALSERYCIDLCCLIDTPADRSYVSDLEEICRGRVQIAYARPMIRKVVGIWNFVRGGTISVGYFYRNELQETVDSWLQEREYQAVFCFSSTMAEYVFRSSAIPALVDKPRLVMDFCDLDSDKWLQYSVRSTPLQWLYLAEGKRLAEYEIAINAEFDASIFVTDDEANLLKQNSAAAKNVSVVMNGVNYDYFSPTNSVFHMDPGLNLLFTGAMDYHANVDAVSWFCKEALKAIQQVMPSTKLLIVGSNPAAAVRKLEAYPGVTVTGFVEDIRPYYEMADICVVPIRLGRGVQNKVLEAMAMGKAVVATSKAANPLRLIHGENAMIADSPSDFVTTVKQLAEQPDLRQRLGVAARNYIQEHFDWNSNLAALCALCVRC